MVVGARQSFQFFRQIAWFLGNNRALSKFMYRNLYNLISITKLKEYHSITANFNLTTRAILKSGSHLSKKIVLFASMTKPFKNDGKCFLL